MNIPKNIIIQCSSFTLRPWRIEDTASLCLHANNSNVAMNLRDIFPFPYTLSDAEFFIINIASNPKNLVLAFEIDGNACGAVGIHPDADANQAELGYWLGEQYWGKGIATEAVNAIVDYGFQTLSLKRIHASVFEQNKASMRVLEKCGFVKEVINKKAILKNNVFLDEHVFAKYKNH